MRQALPRAAWSAALIAGLLSGCAPHDEGLQRLTQARATAQPEGGPPSAPQTVTLRHRWDRAFPGQDGRIDYALDVPAASQPGPRALLIEQSGNQLSVAVGDAAPQVFGRTPAENAAKAAHAVDLGAEGGTARIQATVQALRGGGLGAVWVGARQAVEARLAWRRVIDLLLPAVYAASLLLMGGLAAGFWWRQRDRVYGCFGLAALFGAVRPLDRLLIEIPLPWALWGAMLAMAYAAHLALIARFVVLVAGPEPAWMPRAHGLLLAAMLSGAAASFAAGAPALWTSALVLMEVFGLLCFGLVARRAWVERRPVVLCVLGAGTAVLGAGLHDLLVVRTGVVEAVREPLAPHALFLFVLVMAGLVVQRYSASVAQVHTLNRELTRRVAEREAQLTEAFEALRQQREQQAAAAERQRIMRDLHDGVGAHLVGLRGLVMQPKPDTAALAAQVEAALDELRMAVDSMQPVHGDLATVLATLRYRLQPRLSAAGLAIVWEVEPLPTLDTLSPEAVLQVQRILLEAFTNVLRHARARTVRVVARHVTDTARGPHVLLQLLDDGIGLPPAGAQGGQGLGNIRARAQAIGAEVSIATGALGGTGLTLIWPTGRPPTNAG